MTSDPTDEASVAEWFCAGLVEMGLALELGNFGADRTHPLPTGDAAAASLTVRLSITSAELLLVARRVGEDAHFMWPDRSVERAGLNLLLTHVQENLATRSFADGRATLTLRDGNARLE